jgi:hypothetical protein
MDVSPLTKKCARPVRLLIGPGSAGWLGVATPFGSRSALFGGRWKDPGKFGHRDDSEQ